LAGPSFKKVLDEFEKKPGKGEGVRDEERPMKASFKQQRVILGRKREGRLGDSETLKKKRRGKPTDGEEGWV